MSERDYQVWRLTLEVPANGILFSAAGNPIEAEAEGLPADLAQQIVTLQADARAFWRRAVEELTRAPTEAPETIVARAGAQAVREAAEALIVALSLARPEVVLEVDIALVP
jgi:hypothetical protein